MPIGSLVPGQPTTVTPDPNPSYYSSFQGPAPDDLIVADHVLAVIQLALNVQQMTLGRIGSPAAVMQAISNAEVADWFFVLNEGLFVYTATTRTDNGPWWYSAPGMSNVGSWVNVYWMTLMSSSNPAKLRSSILPFWQNIFGPVHIDSSATISYSIVNQGSIWIQVPDTNANPVAYTFSTNVASGQRFEFNVMPLQLTCSSGDSVGLRIHISQAGTDYYYILPPCSNTFSTEMSWPVIVYDSTGTEAITIALEATNSNGHTSILQSSNSFGWGPSGQHTWLTLKQSQVF